MDNGGVLNVSKARHVRSLILHRDILPFCTQENGKLTILDMTLVMAYSMAEPTRRSLKLSRNDPISEESSQEEMVQ